MKWPYSESKNLILLLSVLLYSSCSTDSKESSTASTLPSIPVDVSIIKKEKIDAIESISGTILPAQEVEIASEVTKRIISINFKDGASVSSGQLLYKLDDRDIRAKLHKVQAELSIAALNEHRLAELLKTESVRLEEYEAAKAKYDVYTAEKEMLLAELEKTEIRAPFSGRVGISKVHKGAIVQPGKGLVTISNAHTAKIEFSVPEMYLNAVKSNSKISFEIEGSNKIFQANIIAREASLNKDNRSITIQAITSNTQGMLSGGMSAKVHFNKLGIAEGIAIPTEALMPSGNGYSIFLVKSMKAKIFQVELLSRNEKTAVIKSGLNEGDTVIVSNLLRISDNASVNIVSTNKK
ncbi:hypothetical protein CAP35_07070 [Chitinophagaceae bacterium IBVUCB1]|nr:hypothetical protein CAP35_07070 [Chitinophagaceae bacterium IBVUCB1]